MDLISQLPFDLIRPTAYTISRTAIGEFNEEGVYVKPDPIEVPAELVVYPYSKQTIVQILPEALRKKKVIRMHSNIELKELIDRASFEPDEITYNGQAYRVFKLGDWVNVNGFTGYEAYAVRIDTTELETLYD